MSDCLHVGLRSVLQAQISKTGKRHLCCHDGLVQVGFRQDFRATVGLEAGMANRAFQLMEAGEAAKCPVSNRRAGDSVFKDWAFDSASPGACIWLLDMFMVKPPAAAILQGLWLGI